MVRENATVSIRPYWQGRALAGDDGANLRAGAAGLKTVLREEGAERLDIGERMRCTSMVRRVVMAISPLPNFSAASTIARISSG